MKKGIILLFLIFTLSLNFTFSKQINIHLKDGSKYTILLDSLKKITFEDVRSVKQEEYLFNNSSGYFKISPNPTSGSFEIVFNVNPTVNDWLLITDIAGNVISETIIGNNPEIKQSLKIELKSVDGNPPNPGIYFVHFYNNHKIITDKLILIK